MVKRVSWSEAVARRLQRHRLSAPLKNAQPADIAAAICGAHAQILSSAELSLAIRSPKLTRADIHRALWIDHTLIKTYGPRGTVHLLPARDLHWWTGALAALPMSVGMPEDAQLSETQHEKVIDAIADALHDDELTVDELTAAVVARAGRWAGDLVMPAFQTMWPRWRQAIGDAAARGVLCFGPNRGRNVTYTNPRRWLPKFRPAPKTRALKELIRSYLHSYGPATPETFARWLATDALWASKLFNSFKKEVEQVDFEGKPAYITTGDTKFPQTKPRGVRLLPYFDAYVVGSHPRERLYPGKASTRAMARGQAGNFPVLLINGVVAGVWHQRRSARGFAITVEPLAKLTAAQHRELEVQIARIGSFLDAKPQLTVGKVNVGAHA